MTETRETVNAMTREQWRQALSAPPGVIYGFSGEDEGVMNRHRMAAMCLYGQPFGFTIDMANACEFAASRCDDIVASDPDARGPALDAVQLRAAAARIRALLPPPVVPTMMFDGITFPP